MKEQLSLGNEPTLYHVLCGLLYAMPPVIATKWRVGKHDVTEELWDGRVRRALENEVYFPVLALRLVDLGLSCAEKWSWRNADRGECQ